MRKEYHKTNHVEYIQYKYWSLRTGICYSDFFFLDYLSCVSVTLKKVA